MMHDRNGCPIDPPTTDEVIDALDMLIIYALYEEGLSTHIIDRLGSFSPETRRRVANIMMMLAAASVEQDLIFDWRALLKSYMARSDETIVRGMDPEPIPGEWH